MNKSVLKYVVPPPGTAVISSMCATFVSPSYFNEFCQKKERGRILYKEILNSLTSIERDRKKFISITTKIL